MHFSHAELALLRRENKRWPLKLREILPEEWPPEVRGYNASDRSVRISVWRSRRFLVQIFDEPGGVFRLSVNRTDFDPAIGRWKDGITWDELEQLKAECGYGDRWAVEVYPPDGDVVNMGNLRHLWILPEAPAWAWRKKK